MRTVFRPRQHPFTLHPSQQAQARRARVSAADFPFFAKVSPSASRRADLRGFRPGYRPADRCHLCHPRPGGRAGRRTSPGRRAAARKPAGRPGKQGLMGRLRIARWRRRRDSNPRYRIYQYDGLANRWFQPLTHVSGSQRRGRAIARAARGGKGLSRGFRRFGQGACLCLRHGSCKAPDRRAIAAGTRFIARATRTIAECLQARGKSALPGNQLLTMFIAGSLHELNRPVGPDGGAR